jgi:hypothetical protein
VPARADAAGVEAVEADDAVELAALEAVAGAVDH